MFRNVQCSRLRLLPSPWNAASLADGSRRLLAAPSVYFIAAMLLLSGCISQSDIQASYVKSQNQCRTEAARATVTGDSQASLGAAFSRCMIKAGWNVASPKTGVAAATNPPSGSPSTNPIASAARTAPAENTAAANPPSGAPSVKPSASVASSSAPATTAAPAPSTAPATATYQPARPSSAATSDLPSYGSGAGRNF